MTSSTTAQDAGTADEAPTLAAMFPIPDEARTLERFLGAWDVAGTITMEGNALPVTGAWHFTPVAGGRGVKSALAAQIEGLGAYEEDDLVGFDVETGTFHVYSLTNTAAVHDHLARWITEHVFEMTFEGTQGGQPYRENARREFTGPAELRVVSTDYVNGALASQMEVTLRRR